MSEQPTILVVGDTPSVLGLLVKLLTPEGYLVRAASSGEQALADLAASPPDLILLDVQSREMAGIELCRQLKASEKVRHLPIILISGHADVEVWVAGLKAGASDYITKPFQSEELLARVATHLALRRARLALEEEAGMLLETTTRLKAEIARRQQVEDDLRQSLEQAERSRRALLSALEDQKLSEAALRASETKYRELAENLNDVVFTITDQGVLSYISPSILAMGGYAPEELVGKSFTAFVVPADVPGTQQSLRDTLGGHLAPAEFRCLAKDGRIRWVRSSSRPIVEGDRVTGLRGVLSDITERKEAEARRQELEAQLLQSHKMESIGRLAGGVAHDFNNCLNVIQGFAQLCLAEAGENERLADDLLQVLKASDRAALLTRQLLAFGRKQVLQPEVLDLNQALAEMEKMLRRIIGEDIELVIDLAPDLGLVKADPGQLGQVIMNLAINARDAMPNGGTLTIETTNLELDAEQAARHESTAAGAFVVVAVTDTGKGMDGPTLAHIFEPFFTTKGIGKGSGLGLSMAYGIVKQSGGSIHVTSEVGRGTTFQVYLPRVLSATAATDSRPRPMPVRATGDETILVVEDEEGLRLLATTFLQAAGYTVLSAADGEQALLACERHADDIDLLLTDVVMPRVSGKLLAERLKRIKPALKILYMSGYPDQAILHQGVLEAGTQFLAKPFSEAELTRKVRTVLDGILSTTGADWPAIKDEVQAQPAAANTPPAQPQDIPSILGQAATRAGRVENDKQGRTVLIVDDSPDNLRLLTAILKRGGLLPRPVRSGSQAIKAATADPPDLVLLDMRMPEMSGLEVCRRFKQDERLRDVPVIFVSGLQERDDIAEGLRAGGVDFVSKPVQEEVVLARIETHLRLRQLETKLQAYQEQLGSSR
jgi:two-component system cell cycle sensor histidine kinase/response regulator CckA